MEKDQCSVYAGAHACFSPLIWSASGVISHHICQNSCYTVMVKAPQSHASHPPTETFLPNPMSVPVTHIISDMSEATDRAAVATFPYLIWKGSIMVTYLLFLMGSAKNRPPQ